MSMQSANTWTSYQLKQKTFVNSVFCDLWLWVIWQCYPKNVLHFFSGSQLSMRAPEEEEVVAREWDVSAEVVVATVHLAAVDQGKF